MPDRVVAEEHLPVRHHSAEYISFLLGSLGFENGVPLMYKLEGVSSVANIIM